MNLRKKLAVSKRNISDMKENYFKLRYQRDQYKLLLTLTKGKHHETTTIV